jgi:hypothetical protein
MNIFESTFEKHKKLLIEAIATNKDLADDELALKGGKDKNTKKANAAAEKKKRGWEGDEVQQKDAEEKIGKFNPQEFWNNFKEMPVSQFVQTYKNVFTDPKIKAFISSGANDTDDKEAFIVQKGTLPVSQLVPTQNEIGFGNSVDDLCKVTFDEGKQLGDLQKILEGNGVSLGSPNKPDGDFIIVYNNKYIIDGHHRWSKITCGNKNATAACLNFKSTSVSLTPEQVLKAFHLAIASDIGKIPTSSASGKNLIGGNPEEVKQAISLNLSDASNTAAKKFMGVYNQYMEPKGKEKSPEQVGEYIGENSKVITSVTPATDTPRSAMPQTDNSQKFQDALEKGDVNFAADAVSGKIAQKENFISESTFKKFRDLYTK